MKHLFRLVICLLLTVSVQSTFSQMAGTEASMREVYRRKYALSLRYNDILEAKGAALSMLALGDSSFRDSLVQLYFGMENYASAYLVAKELFVRKPEDPNLLELMATCEQQLGLGMEALLHYTTLYRKTKNVYFQYQIATLQYSLKRGDEAKRTIEEIIVNPEAAKVPVYINYDANSGQEVPVKAAALNLKGAIFAEEGNDPVAIASLNEAISLKKDFLLARENLSGLLAQIKKKAAEAAAKAAETPAAASQPAGNN